MALCDCGLKLIEIISFGLWHVTVHVHECVCVCERDGDRYLMG